MLLWDLIQMQPRNEAICSLPQTSTYVWNKPHSNRLEGIPVIIETSIGIEA